MSAAGRYRYLFSPLRVGPVVVRNRIVFSAHLTNYAEDGLPSQQHADYYAARAAGGVGLIITEEHSTHPTDWPYEKLIHGFHRAVIPGYQNITAAVRNRMRLSSESRIAIHAAAGEMPRHKPSTKCDHVVNRLV